MPNIGVEVAGSKELRRSLKAAGDDLNNLKDVHQTVGKLVEGIAKNLAPKRSGDLAGTIRATRTARGVGLKAGNARVPYAGPIHWGWPARNIKSQPFLVEAASRTEDQWVALYFSELERIVGTVHGDE